MEVQAHLATTLQSGLVSPISSKGQPLSARLGALEGQTEPSYQEVQINETATDNSRSSNSHLDSDTALTQDSTPITDLFLSQNISWLFRLPQYITAFFERFHPSFPSIHRPTFDASITKEPLLQAVACVGALYHSPGKNRNIGLALFQAGHQALDKYVW